MRRKCGTCAYYRDCGVAGSGWCTHPQRGELLDLVLVRRAELACRTHQDQDLWQPAETQHPPAITRAGLAAAFEGLVATPVTSTSWRPPVDLVIHEHYGLVDE